MNKAFAIAALALMMQMSWCAIFIIPPQFITGSKEVYPSAPLVSNALAIKIDLVGYEKYIGKNLTTWWGAFKFALKPSGFEFMEDKYRVNYSGYNNYYCPHAADTSCGFNDFGYLGLYSFNTFSIYSPVPSINVLDVKSYILALTIQAANGDIIYATYSNYTIPMKLTTTNFYITQPNFLIRGCANFTINNPSIMARDTAYSIQIAAPVLNPNPISGGAVTMFFYPDTVFYWDGVQMNTTKVFNNGTYYFDKVLDFSKANFSSGNHRLDMCNIVSPNYWGQLMNVTIMDTKNLTLATTTFFPNSNETVVSRIRGLSQSSMVPLTPFTMNFNISSGFYMNWDDTYYLEFGVPAAYSGWLVYTIVITNYYDGTKLNYDIQTGNFMPRIPISKSKVSLVSGLGITITGFNVPLIDGGYNFTIQLYSSTLKRVSLKHNIPIAVQAM